MIKALNAVLVLLGIGLCIAAFMGNSQAWAGAALCFFAVTVMIIGKRKK